MEKLLTISQLSERLQIPKGTLYRWVHAQFVPHYKIGRAVRFNTEEIDRWLKKRRVRGRAAMKIDIL